MTVKEYTKKKTYNNLFLAVVILITVFFLKINVTLAQTSTQAKAASSIKKTTATKSVPKKKTVKSVKTAKDTKTKTTLKWTADGIRALGSMASFDYSYSIRNAFIKKIENYARRKNIKVINAKVVNSMDE